MKTCPVCQSKAFDDASICYGCLYRYEDQEHAREERSEIEQPGHPERVIERVPYSDERLSGELPLDADALLSDADALRGGSVETTTNRLFEADFLEMGALEPNVGGSPANAGIAPEASPVFERKSAGPAFFIRMTPMLADSGQVTWSCAVELAPC